MPGPSYPPLAAYSSRQTRAVFEKGDTGIDKRNARNPISTCYYTVVLVCVVYTVYM